MTDAPDRLAETSSTGSPKVTAPLPSNSIEYDPDLAGVGSDDGVGQDLENAAGALALPLNSTWAWMMVLKYALETLTT